MLGLRAIRLRASGLTARRAADDGFGLSVVDRSPGTDATTPLGCSLGRDQPDLGAKIRSSNGVGHSVKVKAPVTVLDLHQLVQVLQSLFMLEVGCHLLGPGLGELVPDALKPDLSLRQDVVEPCDLGHLACQELLGPLETSKAVEAVLDASGLVRSRLLHIVHRISQDASTMDTYLLLLARLAGLAGDVLLDLLCHRARNSSEGSFLYNVATGCTDVDWRASLRHVQPASLMRWSTVIKIYRPM